jgi:hypothetical protein
MRVEGGPGKATSRESNGGPGKINHALQKGLTIPLFTHCCILTGGNLPGGLNYSTKDFDTNHKILAKRGEIHGGWGSKFTGVGG